MGMYTEIFFRAELDPKAYRMIKNMNEGSYAMPEEYKLEHEFFRKPRALHLFTASGSYYFPGANHFVAEWDHIARAAYISFRSNIKDYDGEIEAFFDWVKPHVVDEGFYGYSLYEEADTPTLYSKEF